MVLPPSPEGEGLCYQPPVIPPFYAAVFADAETTGGRIRGLVNQGIAVFRGIPYGAAARFRAPVARAPWAGRRDCFAPGAVAPQVPTPISNAYARLIQFDRAPADGGLGEDCLTLNVYAPQAPAPPRPVLVVIHGGGFAIGSGNAPMYDGTMMALSHDVVVVAINHRLNLFGFLGLAGLGADERHAGSNVAGLLDVVLALEWLRDNAAVFGGDPDRVTLIGQSGGGWKISTLLALPAVQGLFHRAVVQSGSWPVFTDTDSASALTRALLAEFGLGADDWPRLAEIDMGQLLAASVKIGPLAFMPSLDPQFLPWQPDDPRALALSDDVPTIVSTTREDAGLFYDNFDLTDAGLDALLAQRFGADAAAIRALYRDAAPTPYLTHARIITDAGFRRMAHAQADARAGAGVPTWVYRWDWTCPAWDGRYGAAHAMDVPASLARPDDSLLGGASGAALRIAAEHSAMMAGFAADGVPGGPFAEAWARHDASRRACLIVSDETHPVDDPDGEARAFWAQYPMPASVA
jgi:para-nitrobenzyl esterase